MKILCFLCGLFIFSSSYGASWDDVSKLVQGAHKDKLFSESALSVGSSSQVFFELYAGDQNSSKIFDLASLTKVVAATTSFMILEERGLVSLNDKVQKFFPAFSGQTKNSVTLEDLLRHRSGLPAGARPYENESFESYLQRITSLPLSYKPRSKTVYSDLSFILIGRVVEIVSGKSLGEFARDEIFIPLKMENSGYDLTQEQLSRVVVTSSSGQFEIHDPTANSLRPATVGNAGLFSTIHDLTRFSQMILRKGELDGVRILTEKTIKKMTTPDGPRGLGWDFTSEYASKPRGEVFPAGISFGHTGYTGTTMWLDPKSDSFYVFLSNRVYMGDQRTSAPFGDFRKKLSTAIGKMTALKSR